MTVSLHITYTTGGKCLTVAEIQDHSLLVQAAKVAIKEAQRKAQKVVEMDDFLGLCDAEKSRKLTQLLKLLVPELEERGSRSR